jgi:hypothetical protein
MNEQTQRLDTHFIKNIDFKTVFGSGFYGGFTPSGHLNVFVYTERVPIPSRVSFQLDPVAVNSFSVGPEIDREGKSGLIREVQFGVLFDVKTAEGLMNWLKNQLDNYNQAKNTDAQQQV